MECKKRKFLRLKNYDYSSAGYYFITICTKNRKEILGKIEMNIKENFNGPQNLENFSINYSKIGNIAKECLENLERNYGYINLDAFVIMPNHIHFILNLKAESKTGEKKLTISKIIALFKSEARKKLKKEGIYENIWQRNFFEHIIRDEKEYKQIYDYIIFNPIMWAYDRENEKRVIEKEIEAEKIIFGK